MKLQKPIRHTLILVIGLTLHFAGAPNVQAQEKTDPSAESDVIQQTKTDPSAESDVIQQTLSKIRDVERLDTFVQQNLALKEENKQLKANIASIQKQITKLTKDLADQTAILRKQLLQMPTFEVQSKILGGVRNMAILRSKDTSIRIREDTQMSVSVADGVWVLMQVRKISKEMIELYFPELERTVYLYD